MHFANRNTDRLYLRNISPTDRDFILSEFSDQEVNQYLYDAEPFVTLKDADELIDFYLKQEDPKWNRWIMIRKEDEAKIGTIGFHCWYQKTGSVEVGYDMPKIYWGKGYAFEALQEVIRFAKEEMKVSEIQACIALENKRSISLILRSGFQDSGETRSLHFHDADHLHAIYKLRLDS
ncbi:MAG TPA: GNAT family N-acetyltransferase [Bacillota bacterium]|nr:GNAT family N-acetyltransferase [Bacillota bacterium]